MLAFKCEEKVPHLMLRKDWLAFEQKQSSPGPSDSQFVSTEEQPFVLHGLGPWRRPLLPHLLCPFSSGIRCIHR